MTGRWSSRSAHLEALLDAALELDAPARERFLDTVDPELREDLAKLLKADATPSPVDHSCAGLDEAAAALSEHDNAQNTIVAGQQIGHYRLLRLLGEGGMASVWLAERDDGSFSHQVAVKCLKTGLATPESRTRFLREQQILAQLQHPYIARLYDAGVSSDTVPFIVMEWVDGVSLTRYCDEHRLGLMQRLQLFQKVCSAVAYAHQNLVVHRDLKPGNILVSQDGEPKLLDFGIAKLLDESEPVTRSGVHMLTPEYAAPEQFSGSAITTATDVYALGAVLYEVLCGLRPRHFSRNRPATEIPVATAPSEALRRVSKTITDSTDPHHPRLLAAQRNSAPERLRKSLRGDLDTIVLKALQAEPTRRYTGVTGLSEDIERYLQQQPITARKDAWTYRTSKFLQRHVAGVALSILVAIALLAATAISIYQAQRAQIQTKRALATREFLTNLFEISDAGMPRDQVPTTQTLLEDGAKRIGSEFGDAPELKFDLLILLGRIQRNLGQYDSAEPLLKEALDIANVHFSPASETWLQAHSEWAALLLKRSQFEVAEQQLTAAIAQHRQAGATDNAALTEALSTLGEAYQHLDRFDQAIAVSQEALAMSKRLFGEHDPHVQQALQFLSQSQLSAARLDEAEATARADVIMSRELYGEHQAKFAQSLSELASALWGKDKSDEAEPLARQALAIDETVYDRPNNEFVSTLTLLGNVLFNQVKLDEAKSVFQRALTMQTQLTGPESAPLAEILKMLGNTATEQHAYPEAEHFLRQALDLTRKHYGPKHSRMAATLHALGYLYRQQQRYDEAIAIMQEELEIDRLAYGNNSDQIGRILNDLALTEVDAGHSQPALAHVDEALRILEKSLGADNLWVLETRWVKATVLDGLGRYAEAKALLTPLVRQWRQSALQTKSALITNFLICGLEELGRVQWSLGETDNALTSWQEQLALQRARQEPDTQDVESLIALARKPQAAGAVRATLPKSRY